MKRAGETNWTETETRGAFTIDGVMGRGGFVPTELNPRLGAALFSIPAIKSVEIEYVGTVGDLIVRKNGLTLWQITKNTPGQALARLEAYGRIFGKAAEALS